MAIKVVKINRAENSPTPSTSSTSPAALNPPPTPPDPPVASAKKEKNPSHRFEAVGIICGKIIKTDAVERFQYVLKTPGGGVYPLKIASFKYKKWMRDVEKILDSSLVFLRVYPQFQIFPDRRPGITYFKITNWKEAKANPWKEPVGLFTIRGVWQQIPQVRTPVITVYRNVKTFDVTKKFKAVHLPILMRRDDANPFRFNPKVSKEDAPKKWFIQAKFRFVPQKNAWGWIEDVEPPTQKLPKYKKPVKVEKKTEGGAAQSTEATDKSSVKNSS